MIGPGRHGRRTHGERGWFVPEWRAASRCAWLTVILVAIGCAAPQGQDGLGISVTDSYVTPKGAFVSSIAAGSAAARAGLVPGDVVTACDGHPMTTAQDLVQYVSPHKSGDVITLRVFHAGTRQTTDVRVTLGAQATVARGSAPAPQATPSRSHGTKPDVQWARFTDPVEHAFTIDVPAGWRVSGGSRRMSAVEIRLGVNIVSPDGRVSLFYGDTDVPIYTPPSRMLAMAGLREGMVYRPGQGVEMRIMPYLNGEAFARQWGSQRITRACPGASLTGSKARPEASQAIDLAYAQGGVRTSILAGEASFHCTLNGAASSGFVFAATELVQSQVSALWDVKVLVGFTAPDTLASGAYGILTHLVASFAIDRAWQARQQAIANQFDRIVAQQNAAVSQAIIANGKALAAASDQLFQHGQQRANDSFNAIEKYDEYGVRGTSDFVNPDTGSRYGFLDNSYAHTYVSNDQRILQTDSENPPGAGWHELQVASTGRQ